MTRNDSLSQSNLRYIAAAMKHETILTSSADHSHVTLVSRQWPLTAWTSMIFRLRVCRHLTWTSSADKPLDIDSHTVVVTLMLPDTQH